ncbi:hypothetical protein [Tsuneonella suprasediminis]
MTDQRENEMNILTSSIAAFEDLKVDLARAAIASAVFGECDRVFSK